MGRLPGEREKTFFFPDSEQVVVEVNRRCPDRLWENRELNGGNRRQEFLGGIHSRLVVMGFGQQHESLFI